MKYWEIIADRLSKVGWSLGWVSAIDSHGRTIWIVDAHRGDGRRFIVHADEKLSAFVELERAVLTVTFYLESLRPDALACKQGTRSVELKRPAVSRLRTSSFEARARRP